MGSNADAAEQLREIADLLDLLGERFKPEAYRRAARSIEALTEPLADVAGRQALRSIPGVGTAIAEKLGEWLATGSIPYLERLRGDVPPGLLELMRLPGVGPKTTRRFWTELGVTGRTELAAAIEAGRLTGVAGFKERKIGQLRAALGTSVTAPPSTRRPIEEVYPIAQAIRTALERRAPTEQVEIAGSFRRGRETVGDLDVLVTSRAPERVFDVFSALPEVGEIRLRGDTKETVVLRSGLQVDLRVVAPESFGAALQYFTGSKDHNVRLRSLARDRGLKINEYGVFRGEERVAGRSEEEVYGQLGLDWIPPELREDRGEIDRARDHRLPPLISLGELAGEPHLHLGPGEDAGAVARHLREAHAAGLRYLGIVVATPGSGTELESAPAEVDRAVAAATGPVRALRTVEVVPGTASAAVRALRPDLVVLRPGTLPHDGPSGVPIRLIAHVGGPAADAGPWIARAAALGAALEIGPGPERADSSVAVAARAAGVRLSVATGIGSSDAEATRAVAVGFARRAGARRDDVLNSGPIDPTPRRSGRRATGTSAE